MKKIFLLLAVITVCAIAYFNIGPEEKQYLDESDVQAYLNLGPEDKQYLDESEVQAYLNLGLEENQYIDESDIQAHLNMGPEKKQYMDENDVQAYTPKKNRYHAVKQYKPRASTLGFSIIPPPGVSWYEKLENDSLFYVKISKSHKRYSILTEAREVRLSKDLKNSRELQSYVKSEKEKPLVSSNIKKPNVTVQIEASLSENCVRYSQSYQDHGMKGLRGRRYVNVDTQGLVCLHPDNARIGADVSYVEKSLSNTVAKSYSNEGEMFLASLNFQKLNRK